MSSIRHLGGRIVRFIHRTGFYRRIAKHFIKDVLIRKASDADLQAVHHWLNPHGDHSQAVQHRPYLDQWVALQRKRVVGFVQLVEQPPEHYPYTGFWLFSLMVKLTRRRAGIGEALSQAVIDRASQKGAACLRLVVYEDNLPAVRLYHKLGFKQVRLPDLSDQLDQEAAQTLRRRIILEKQLNS